MKLAYVKRAIKVYDEFMQSDPKNLQALLRLTELKKQAGLLKREMRMLIKTSGSEHKKMTEKQEVIQNLRGWLQKIREVTEDDIR